MTASDFVEIMINELPTEIEIAARRLDVGDNVVLADIPEISINLQVANTNQSLITARIFDPTAIYEGVASCVWPEIVPISQTCELALVSTGFAITNSEILGEKKNIIVDHNGLVVREEEGGFSVRFDI